MIDITNLSVGLCYYGLIIERARIDPKRKISHDISVPIIEPLVFLGMNISAADLYPASCFKAYNSSFHSDEDALSGKVTFYYFQDAYSYIEYGNALSKPIYGKINVRGLSKELVINGIYELQELLFELSKLK